MANYEFLFWRRKYGSLFHVAIDFMFGILRFREKTILNEIRVPSPVVECHYMTMPLGLPGLHYHDISVYEIRSLDLLVPSRNEERSCVFGTFNPCVGFILA
jgi:hypothetical protein